MSSPNTSAPVAPDRLPLLGHAVQLRRRPLAFLQSVRGLGDVVRIQLGPRPAYVVNHPELVRQVLVTDARRYDKGAFFDKVRAIVGNGLVSSNGTFHLRQRRLMQPAFHHRQIAHYADIMRDYLVDLAESWRPGQALSVHETMHEVALALIGRTLFSSDIGAEAVAEVKRSIPIVRDGVTRRTLAPIELLEKLPTPGNRRFEAAIVRIRRVIDEVIRAYRADGVDRGDLLSMLIRSRDRETGESMTDEQVSDEVVTVMLAGSETTANTMAWAFYRLGRHPEIADRLAREADEVLGGEPLTFADLPKLEYTGRVLKEVVRLYPLWLVMRRSLTGVTLGGVRLPAGAEVVLSPLTMHRDPALFPDPLRFDPDRWLPERAGRVPRHAFIPFGSGNRQCIGDEFGWTEAMIALTTIAARWRLEPRPGHVVTEAVAATVYPSSLPMVAVPRRGAGG
ncbi:cytochrome P450 [Plantactinospora endophytica]|uniref:Cytochrome P450 n=1 Tax=Plantactinospora endophytica TaxID=673535 RepID=A0ABQ4E0X2_9ACTN|nr:cytochrome P450 [Plantactinospora endophytica]GIG88355.1 cytochrome P450 [Plantactinospora endophytica]